MINRISFKLSFLPLLLLISALNSFASASMPSDSLRVKWVDGKKFVLHKVDPKETWLVLSKRYNAALQDLKNANHGVVDLKIGQIINVPVGSTNFAPDPLSAEANVKSTNTQMESVETTATVKENNSHKTPILYSVKQGETLYSISRKFEQSVENIKAYNKLSSDALINGQKLIVRYSGSTLSTTTSPIMVVETSPAKTADSENSLATTTIKKEIAPAPAEDFEKPTKTAFPVKKGNSGKTLMQVNETGAASWIQDGQLNQTKYYGLHRTAPIGTIIKVTNRMNNEFVYVKIVGVLPDTGDNDNLIIKVSQAVSSKLNALDSRFRVELSYGVMQ